MNQVSSRMVIGFEAIIAIGNGVWRSELNRYEVGLMGLGIAFDTTSILRIVYNSLLFWEIESLALVLDQFLVLFNNV